MDYRERLASLVEQRGLSHEQLAKRSGVSRSNISTLLKQQGREIAFSGAIALARTLDVSLDWLAKGEPWRSDQLTPDEDELLRAYRDARDDTAREVILQTVRHMSEIGK